MGGDGALASRLESIDAVCASLQLVTRGAPLHAFLQHVANVARVLVAARYCALGVIEGDQLSDFIVSGISEAEQAAIGALPRGHGMLGAMIHARHSLRLTDLRTDPRAVGFPLHHPPMSSFLGVPIRLDDTVFGYFCLTEKLGAASFSLADQLLIERLARHAAVAIASTDGRSEVEQILEELPVPIVVRAAPSLQLLAMNRRARHLIGAIPAFRASAGDLATVLRARHPDGTPFATEELPTVRAVTTGEPVEGVEMVVDDQAGNTLAIIVSSTPIADATGAVREVATWYHDVTETRVGERVREHVLAHLAEELVAPLAAIRSAIATLTTRAEDMPEDVRAALRADLVAQSERFGHLLANVRSLTTAPTGKLPLVRKPVAVPALLRKVTRVLQAQIGTHRFRVDAPADLPMADADAELITFVVRNLAERAARDTPRGGTIAFSAQTEGGQVIVTARAAGAADTVASPRRGTRTDKDPLAASLPLWRRIIGAHGGRLWIERTPGQEAAISFSLPLAAPTDGRGALPPRGGRLLTPRDREVLDGLVRGQTNRQIAAALGLSVNTVKTHVANILVRLGATDRTQAAVRAVALGLVRAEEPVTH